MEGSERMSKATDKSVNGSPVTAKLKDGVVSVENKLNGVMFSFPLACWPAHWNKTTSGLKQLEWITRLTPWWDAPEWTPLAHRLRESCVKAINKLL